MGTKAYFRCAGFRTIGSAATPHNLMSIENAVASPMILVIERIYLTMDATAVLITAAAYAKLSRPTALPTGGTTLTRVADDPREPLNSSITARGATASDGGAARAITATAGTTSSQSFLLRMHTAVGQIICDPHELIRRDRPMYIMPGGALLLQIVATTGTSNPATNHYCPVIEGYETRRI